MKLKTNQFNVEINDPVYNTNKKLNAIDKFFVQFINDKRDLPFIYHSLRILFIQVPFALCFYIFPNTFNWWIGVPYLVILTAFLFGPFTLMLHNTSHNTLFKQKYHYLNNFIPWFIGLFYGQPPRSYYAHHIGMHHSENNMLTDLSSTLPYKRDSFIDFMKYFGIFFTIGLYQLITYFKKRNLKKFVQYLYRGESFFWILVFVLSFVNFRATLIVFIIPLVLIRFLMMAGNWGQHAFVDKYDPENNYRNSITCINSHYNKVAFNDGYHIGHHLHPSMHWTEMPLEFTKNAENYAKEKAIIFRKLDFFAVWLLLMTKQYGLLAKFYIDLDDKFSSKEEIVQFLKSRTQWTLAA